MAKHQAWELELGEYVRQGEPDKTERTAAWQAAIGLQAVDQLQTSEYLLQTAKEHIEGAIDIASARQRIESYYQAQEHRHAAESGTMEADIVSARIAQLLGEKTFSFSPSELPRIHAHLFTGIFSHAGQIRPYNITKAEWVLAGDTVTYAAFQSIPQTLEHDFGLEKQFAYDTASLGDAVRHIARFTSDIWQIHPFGEGNTRTTAVFIIKYLQKFGFRVKNEVFAQNSWYFRNALVRANYANLPKGIRPATSFLEAFFENLLLHTNHELKNRYMHIDYVALPTQPPQSAISAAPKCKICTLDCTLGELAG